MASSGNGSLIVRRVSHVATFSSLLALLILPLEMRNAQVASPGSDRKASLHNNWRPPGPGPICLAQKWAFYPDTRRDLPYPEVEYGHGVDVSHGSSLGCHIWCLQHMSRAGRCARRIRASMVQQALFIHPDLLRFRRDNCGEHVVLAFTGIGLHIAAAS